MALKNSKDYGILNGAIYYLQENHGIGDGTISIVNEYGESVEIRGAWIEDLEDMPLLQENWGFAWGYCCTVHKSQGSSFENIILVDEYNSRQSRREWVYTGITRAEKSVIIQRQW